MSDDQGLHELHHHRVMFNGCDDGANNDAADDDQVKERVRDKGVKLLFEPSPAATTVPLQEGVSAGAAQRPVVLLCLCNTKLLCEATNCVSIKLSAEPQLLVFLCL